jgi:branched-chain amino acid transport system substrate-binding protein
MRNAFVATALMLGTVTPAMAQSDTIKIAYIEPLSGGGASVGDGGLKHFQFFAEQINASGASTGRRSKSFRSTTKPTRKRALCRRRRPSTKVLDS